MKNNKGASLVELSIVLAIIGLLIAAIVEGVNLRKSAEIRGFVTEISTFQNSIEGFNSKYNDLPGDMSDALSYWTTVNGNSNGKIELGSGTASEAYRVWQHLVLSEFLGGGYTGIGTTTDITVTTGVQANIGANVPASKRTKVGYSVCYDNDATATLCDTEMVTGEGSRNEIITGAFYAGNVNTNSAFTPQESYAIDKKMDDGIPATGFVHGRDGSDATATNCVLAAVYNSAITSTSCILTFPIKP